MEPILITSFRQHRHKQGIQTTQKDAKSAVPQEAGNELGIGSVSCINVESKHSSIKKGQLQDSVPLK